MVRNETGDRKSALKYGTISIRTGADRVAGYGLKRNPDQPMPCGRGLEIKERHASSRRFLSLLVSTAFVLLCVSAKANDSTLRSPWDLRTVSPTDAAYTCREVPALPRDFAASSYYTDSHYSVIDPVLKKRYEDSVSPIETVSRVVVAAADAYQAKGSLDAARCVSTLLENAAKQEALAGKMDGPQAFYVRNWNLGSWAVSYLKIRKSGLVSDEQSHEILKWLKKLAEDTRGYFEQQRQSGAGDAANNHLYWAGFTVSAAAIANNDQELFRWGLAAYRQGIHQIQKDGTLPKEMSRGQMALHYHLYALVPLLMLAEFGETNGFDLYAERGYAIKRLVARSTTGLQDASYFQQKTGVAQVTTQVGASWELGWVRLYERRFPNPNLSALIAQTSLRSCPSLGGLPPP
jgi:poly(beta-D-mannuronate) lyase